jgi:hypothetical protein
MLYSQVRSGRRRDSAIWRRQSEAAGPAAGEWVMSVMGKKIKQIREGGYRGRFLNVMVRIGVILQ